MQITISELRKFLQCPRSFYLSEVLGVEPEHKSIAACRANTIKKVLSVLHSKREQDIASYTSDETTNLCSDVWRIETNDPLMNQADLDTIVVKEKKATKNKPAVSAITKREKILATITEWVTEYIQENINSHVLCSDIYFQTPIANCTFVGYIDMIRRVDNVLEVVIFSTGSAAPNIEFCKHDFIASLLSHSIWQGKFFPSYPNLDKPVTFHQIPKLSIYHFPDLEKYEKNPKKGQRKGPFVYDISRSKDDLLSFEYELMYTISSIKQKFFPKLPHSLCRCSLCPYANACKTNPIFQNENTSFDIEALEEDAA